jgi:hypothetical protein
MDSNDYHHLNFLFFPPLGYRKSQFSPLCWAYQLLSIRVRREKVSPISQSDVSGLSAA